MQEIFDFIKEHWGASLCGLFIFNWIIIKLTPTEKEDQLLKLIVDLLQYFIPDRRKRKRTPGL